MLPKNKNFNTVISKFSNSIQFPKQIITITTKRNLWRPQKQRSNTKGYTWSKPRKAKNTANVKLKTWVEGFTCVAKEDQWPDLVSERERERDLAKGCGCGWCKDNGGVLVWQSNI